MELIQLVATRDVFIGDEIYTFNTKKKIEITSLMGKILQHILLLILRKTNFFLGWEET